MLVVVADFDRTKKYYKVTKKYENHKYFQYTDGLNILREPFAETGSCCPGGLYFTDEENIHNFYSYGEWIREIEIPEDSKLVKDTGNNIVKFRTDKIIFNKKHPLYAKSTVKTLNLKVTKDYLARYFTHNEDSLADSASVIKESETLSKFNSSDIRNLYNDNRKLLVYLLEKTDILDQKELLKTLSSNSVSSEYIKFIFPYVVNNIIVNARLENPNVDIKFYRICTTEVIPNKPVSQEYPLSSLSDNIYNLSMPFGTYGDIFKFIHTSSEIFDKNMCVGEIIVPENYNFKSDYNNLIKYGEVIKVYSYKFYNKFKCDSKKFFEQYLIFNQDNEEDIVRYLVESSNSITEEDITTLLYDSIINKDGKPSAISMFAKLGTHKCFIDKILVRGVKPNFESKDPCYHIKAIKDLLNI